MKQYFFLYFTSQLQKILLFLIIILFTFSTGKQSRQSITTEIISKSAKVLAPIRVSSAQINLQQDTFILIINELFRLRNEHKADSLEKFYSDIVLAYMKYLRNVPRKEITRSDKQFWKRHPKNKFVMTSPVQIKVEAGITKAIVIGKEYPDGSNYQYERIEIKFDRNKKINSFRAVNIKGP
jgi:hypothetical protein